MPSIDSLLPNKKAMVCGYFDGFHPGHLRFLEKASSHGELVVGIGSDERMKLVKGAYPMFNERERLEIVQACRHVSRAFILSQTTGDYGVVWEKELIRERPDVFIVNDDLSHEWRKAQEKVCERHGVCFHCERRDQNLEHRAISSTDMRERKYPYRICLTTGMDQVSLSAVAQGACIGFSIEPSQQFEDRCGMATSTRKALMRAYGGNGLPTHLDAKELAQVALALDNTPQYPTGINDVFPFGSFGPRYVTGSVDPITMLVPGVSLCEYQGGPWPTITTIDDDATLSWLESATTLFRLNSRPPGEHFQLIHDHAIIKEFACATYAIWDAVRDRHLHDLQRSNCVCGCASN